MIESNEPSPAATREPQQQSPSTSTSCILLWRRWRGSTLLSRRPRQLRSAFFRCQETPSPTYVHVWPTRTPKTSFSYTLTSICGSLQPTAAVLLPGKWCSSTSENRIRFGRREVACSHCSGGCLSLSKGGVHFLAVSERCTYLPVKSSSYCSCPLSLSFRFSLICCSFSCFCLLFVRFGVVTVVVDGRGTLSCWSMTRIGGIALWVSATINENIPSYHMYQVLGVTVHVIVLRNCNNTAVCVQITPHLTCACNIPSRSKGVYCLSYMHVVYETGTDRRKRGSRSPVWHKSQPRWLYIRTCRAMYIPGSREHHTKSWNIGQISGDIGQISRHISNGGCDI